MKNKKVQKPSTPEVELSNEVLKSADPIGFLKEKLLIVLLAFVSFGASLRNDYALDDYIVLVKNHFVQRGFAGIAKIFSKDTFAGMSDVNLMVLSGGRYRPLSLVTFAIENQFLGNAPAVSHFINVLLYTLCGIVLFNFLHRILHKNTPLALCTSLLFIVLPIHSEAVINIKGRDDIMCLLFFLLAANSLLRYADKAKISYFISACFFYFLSLLSKETAVTFVFIFPLLLYFFTTAPLSKNLGISVILFSVMLLFAVIRYAATKDNGAIPSNDIFNNPFIFMTVTQHYATVFLTWLIYLKLIFYPIHLSYDYNFNHIPASNFGEWRVWLSLLLYGGGFILSLLLVKRKSIYSFAILFFLISFSILSNLFFNIGAPIAERFMLISSLGICLLVMQSLFDAAQMLTKKTDGKSNLMLVYTLLMLIILGSSARNIARCADWKDSNTLFIADVKTVPNNSKANLNASLAYLKLSEDSIQKTHDSAMLDSAKKYIKRAIAIYPRRSDGYLNMGVIYSWKDNFDSAEVWWNHARAIEPNSITLKGYDKILCDYYFKKGLKNGADKNFTESIQNMLHAYRYDTLNAQLNFNLGGAYFTIKEFTKAKQFWEKTQALDPTYPQLNSALSAVNYELSKLK